MHAHTVEQLERASRSSNRRRAGPEIDKTSQPIPSMIGLSSTGASESSRGSID